MIDYIVVAAAITLQEAIDIVHNGRFKERKLTSTGLKSTELKDYGIRELSIWADTKRVFTVSQELENCFYSATIDAEAFKAGSKSYDGILDILQKYLPKKFARKDSLEWKVKSVSFVYNYQGYYIHQYYKMLRSGYDLDNLNMIKETEKIPNDTKECYRMTFSGKGRKTRKKTELKKTDKKKYPKKRYQEAMNIEVLLDYRKKYNGPDIQYLDKRVYDDYLQIKVRCKKIKTIQLCNEYGVKDRDFYQFVQVLDRMDYDIINNYISRIGGRGKYYRYADAEAIIMASDLTDGKKAKMCDALKGVAKYKGISNYLSHVEMDEPYPFMQSMKKRSYAMEALNQLQKIGINPITIPVHARLFMSQEYLPNLVGVYEDAKQITSDVKDELAVIMGEAHNKRTIKKKDILPFDLDAEPVELPFT